MQLTHESLQMIGKNKGYHLLNKPRPLLQESYFSKKVANAETQRGYSTNLYQKCLGVKPTDFLLMRPTTRNH